jgi:hypothetical protein
MPARHAQPHRHRQHAQTNPYQKEKHEGTEMESGGSQVQKMGRHVFQPPKTPQTRKSKSRNGLPRTVFERQWYAAGIPAASS